MHTASRTLIGAAEIVGSPTGRACKDAAVRAEITRDVVSCLISAQFPQWADLEIRPVVLDGWDNTTFRLGDHMSVRLPSNKMYEPQIDKEHRWLPWLAARLPLPIPEPIARGVPGCGFPTAWSVYRWLEGEPAALVGIGDLDRFADDLGAFLVALQQIDPHGGPPAGAHSFNRGGSLHPWDEQTRAIIDQLADDIDATGARDVWDAALSAPWAGSDVWVHGDVTGSNLLVSSDRLCAVIDFGCSAVGDPACDLTPTWTMFEGSSRDIFRERLESLDRGTWARARGWALWKALIDIPGRPVDDPGRTGARFGWRWDSHGVIRQVIADHLANG